LAAIRVDGLTRLLIIVISVGFGGTVAAEAAADDADPDRQSDLVEEAPAPCRLGFDSTRSVEGTLAETDERQREGPLERFRAQKDALEAGTGLSLGFDNNTQYLGTDSDESPSDAASNVFRFYGTWTLTGRGTSGDGALVFKIEDRTAIGNNPSPQALGPSLGYAGLFSSTFSDAGVVVTNLYWRQRFAKGRGALIVGQVDPSDYISVNSIASPWTGFTNLAFVPSARGGLRNGPTARRGPRPPQPPSPARPGAAHARCLGTVPRGRRPNGKGPATGSSRAVGSEMW